MIAAITRRYLHFTALAAFLVLMMLPVSAQAQYRITLRDRSIDTPCYWIERSRLHLCEGGDTLGLSEVIAIESGRMSSLEAEMHRDSMRRFWTYVAWLLDAEADLSAQDKDSQDAVREFEGLKAQTGKSRDLKAFKRKSSEETHLIADGVNRLIGSWYGLRIPERSLVQLSEIKALQMITWAQALAERRMYIRTGDPTYREYAVEHMRQNMKFQESFNRALIRATGAEQETAE